MIKLFAVKTTKEHFKNFALQDEQADEFFSSLLTQDINDGMFSVIGNDKKVYGIFIVVKFWEDRFRIEAFISKDCGNVMFQMISKLKEIYKLNAPVRLEAEVLNSFENGKRFLKLFGFKQESLMKKYYNGKDYCLFVKIKD